MNAVTMSQFPDASLFKEVDTWGSNPYLPSKHLQAPQPCETRPGIRPPTYNAPMASVADDLRRATQQKILELSIEERLDLIGRLSEADVDLYCAAHGASREEAKRVFVRQRRVGRNPSRVMDGTSE